MEDEPALAEWVLQVMRTDSDVRFHHCSDPSEAVTRALEVEPTVIVQELVMQGAHGLTLMARYQAAPALARVPVIMLMAASDVEMTRRAFESGADCLVKSPQPVELMPRIRMHSRRYALEREREELMGLLAKQTYELKEALAELARVAPEDPVTGLATGRLLESTLGKEWKRAARDRTPLSLALVELDFFRHYEQGHGRAQTDQCLRDVTRVITTNARRPADLSARLADDRFALLLPQTHPEGARMVASQVRAEIAALRLPHDARRDRHRIVTASVGVATLVPAPHQPLQLVPLAQQALERATQRGRDAVYHASLDGNP